MEQKTSKLVGGEENPYRLASDEVVAKTTNLVLDSDKTTTGRPSEEFINRERASLSGDHWNLQRVVTEIGPGGRKIAGRVALICTRIPDGQPA